MSIIEASSVRVQTMADGTLRIICDVEPRHARDAFALFGAPGVPMALAALKVVSHETPEVSHNEASGAQVSDKPKGGMWAQWCGMRCAEIEFQDWLHDTFPQRWEHAKGTGSTSAEVAARLVREICGIQSRAELDNNDDAKARFDKLIRGPWQRHWQGVHA